jgi:hypothetical protein
MGMTGLGQALSFVEKSYTNSKKQKNNNLKDRALVKWFGAWVRLIFLTILGPGLRYD